MLSWSELSIIKLGNVVVDDDDDDDAGDNNNDYNDDDIDDDDNEKDDNDDCVLRWYSGMTPALVAEIQFSVL